MLSSTLLPKTHRKSPLPKMWPHPPCRNIDVTGVITLTGSASTTQAIPLPSGTASPTRASPVISPATNPRLHTLAANTLASRPPP
jgi:hypothetical protein